MIHKNDLEINMIQGEMSESLLTLNDTFKWLTRLMHLKDFQNKYDVKELSKQFMRKVDAIDNDITIICQRIDDPNTEKQK